MRPGARLVPLLRDKLVWCHCLLFVRESPECGRQVLMVASGRRRAASFHQNPILVSSARRVQFAGRAVSCGRVADNFQRSKQRRKQPEATETNLCDGRRFFCLYIASAGDSERYALCRRQMVMEMKLAQLARSSEAGFSGSQKLHPTAALSSRWGR